MRNFKEQYCRICLSTHDLTDIFIDTTSTVAEKIMYCASVQVSHEDSLPSKICKQCKIYLNVACVFRTVCEQTDSKLRLEMQDLSYSEETLIDSIKRVISDKANETEFQGLKATFNQKRLISMHPMEILLKNSEKPPKLEETTIVSGKESKTSQSLSNLMYEEIFLQTFPKLSSGDRVTSTTVKKSYLTNEKESDNQRLKEKTEVECESHKEVNKKFDSKATEITLAITENVELVNEEIESAITELDLIYNQTASVKNCETNLGDADDSNIQENFLNDQSSVVYEEDRFISEETCLITEDSLNTQRNALVIDLPDLLSHNKHKNGSLCDLIDDDRCLINEECESRLIDNLYTNEKVKMVEVTAEDYLPRNSEFTESISRNDEDKEEINNLISEGETAKKGGSSEEDGLVNETSDYLNNDKSVYDDEYLNIENPLSVTAVARNKEETDLETMAVVEDIDQGLKDYFKVVPGSFKTSVNEKSVDLENISLHDFESFEKEQLNNAYNAVQSEHVEKNNRNKKSSSQILTKSENRVGRHIAKKNAGQPPKRYSPTPDTTKLPNLKQQIVKDDPSTAAKHTKPDETEEKLEKRDINGLLDHEYILENDLSVPEPIFEETIVTDSFYFTNDENFLENSNNFDHLQSNKEEKVKKRNKKGSIKMKQSPKKVNIFVDQTIIRSKSGTDSFTQKTNSNGIHPDTEDTSDDCDSSSENDQAEYRESDYSDDDPDYCDDQDDYENLQLSHNLNLSAKQKLSNKKSKYKRKGANTTCKLCNKSFPFPSHLQRHLTAHIGIKRFTCKHCNKQFLHRYNLSVHMRSHTGNFPLRCNICNRGFASPSVLERHKRSHTGETPFQCRYCQQMFTHASSLNMHEKMHLNRPSFTCDVCFKVFSYKSSLTAHKKGHSGFKPHICTVCYKRFTRRTSVMRHMSCHSEIKKFKCRTCGEVLSSQSNLVKHRKIHSDT